MQVKSADRLPRIDIHIHLAGDGSSGSGCLLTRRMRRRPVTWMLLRSLAMTRRDLGRAADRIFQETILRWLERSRNLDFGVLLAFDKVYRSDGKPDERRIELYVPNDLVLRLSRQHQRVLAGVSIHPYRPDSIDELDRCIEAGAALVKWIPLSQNIDPSDRRCTLFFDRMAESGLPLLCHTGPEHSFSVVDSRFRDPAILRPALDRGVTVIAAHCGLSVLPWESSYLSRFTGLIEHYSNLYGDIAALCLPRMPGAIKPILKNKRIQDRLVHGSDWPIPIVARALVGQLPWKLAAKLDRITNPLDRDIVIKRFLGLPDEIFHQGAALLPPAVLAEKWPPGRNSGPLDGPRGMS